MARNALLRSSLVGERVWECGGRGRAICAEGRGNAEDEEDPFGWGKERSGRGAVVDEWIGWRVGEELRTRKIRLGGGRAEWQGRGWG